MREIKFRAWDPGRKAMTPDADPFIEEDGEAFIMQYTGLKDRNGKEIYEGDIIDLGEKNIAQVEWVESGFVLILPYGAFQLHSGGEIIGNIYENPELAPSEEEK